MKFKKVEISAFRIYNKPEDANFDFTLSNGDPADFVSIYAPNGFGKTSLYDAIEWGVTNDIVRFRQRGEITNENIRSLRDINDGNQVKLLRHTAAKKAIKTFVSITTDGAEIPKRILDVHGKHKSDITDNPVIENRNFQRVILSQEWISAFLTESNGVLRYEKFMNNPELTDTDAYYKKVSNLLATCEQSINTLYQEITGLRSSVIEIEDSNLLETIHSASRSLIEKGESIPDITPGTSDKEAMEFKNLTGTRILDYTRKADAVKAVIANIEKARSGDDKMPGVALYLQQISEQSQAKKEIDTTKVLLQSFDTLEKNKNEQAVLQEQRKTAVLTESNLKTLLGLYADFVVVQRKIAEMNSEIQRIQEKSAPLIEELTRQQNEFNAHQIRLEQLSKQLAEANAEKSKIPDKRLRFSFLQEKISLTDTWQSDLDKQKTEKTALRDKANERLTTLNSFLSAIEANNYTIVLPEELADNANILTRLSELQQQILEIGYEVAATEQRLKDQQSFNSILEEFVAKGLEIVNSTQTSSCPLCTQTYESYSQLAQKISGNNLLSSRIQEILVQQSEIQSRQLRLQEESAEQRKRLLNAASSKRDEFKLVFSNLSSEITNIQAILKSKTAEKDELLAALSALNHELGHLEPDEFEKRILTLIQSLETDVKATTGLSSGSGNKVNTTEETLKILLARRANLETEIDRIKTDRNYIQLNEWFLLHSTNGSTESSILESKINEAGKTIADINNAIAPLEITIKETEEQLKQYTTEGLSVQLNRLNGKYENLAKSIAGYESYFKKNIGDLPPGASLAGINNLLDEKEKAAKEDLNRHTSLLEAYSKLSEYASNLIPFLQTEAAKALLKTKEEEYKFLESTVKEYIRNEKERIRKYLEQKIKGFFYEDLINELYNKIDPHPDFKGVSFSADFDSPTPRLDVLVTNKQDEQKLIPNLYFSTAQINILSLSIFLASALNSNEYNCIFIDDPIQSMDSINVLSTIDLLRGIVITGKKQIILSTHDENFHNLLKKKMPPELFKSKFLELETFGKVKQH